MEKIKTSVKFILSMVVTIIILPMVPVALVVGIIDIIGTVVRVKIGKMEANELYWAARLFMEADFDDPRTEEAAVYVFPTFGTMLLDLVKIIVWIGCVHIDFKYDVLDK